MKSFAKLAVITTCLFGSVFASAAEVTVFVDGRSGAWDIAANPTYNYGVVINGQMDRHLAPTSVSSASGLSFAAGNTLSLQYVNGLANAGGGGLYYDANGISGWTSDAGAPGQYVAGTNYLMQLFGAFANSSGAMVNSPFLIGNSASVVIPLGATQLLMGFNDGWYNDNGAGLNMKVSGLATVVSAPVPEPETYAMLLAGLGLMGGIARRRKATQA